MISLSLLQFSSPTKASQCGRWKDHGISAIGVAFLDDCNLDGVVDFSDIPAFVEILQAGTFLSEADGNQDGEVTFADIPRVYCNSDCQLGGLSTAFHRVLVDGQPITISDSPF